MRLGLCLPEGVSCGIQFQSPSFLEAGRPHGTQEPEVFLTAVGDVAKARGMTSIARETGLGRESLYKAFAPGARPGYETVQKVLGALGVKLTVSPL